MRRWNKLAFLVGIYAVLCILVALGVGNLCRQRFVIPHQNTLLPTPLPGTAISEELTCDLYDCALTLTAGASLPAQSRVRLMLEGGRAYCYTAVDITGGSITVVSVHEHTETVCERISLVIPPGTPYRLTVLRRGALLGLVHDGAQLFVGHVPHAPGSSAAYLSGQGWTVRDIAARALEPVSFADDFMRNADTPGAWQIEQGQWRLQTAWDEDPHGDAAGHFQHAIYAQNPFAWHGEAVQGCARCTTGKSTWEDYTFTAAVRPGAHGAVGLESNLDTRGNGYLVRWSAANDHGARGNSLTVLERRDERLTVLATSPGGFIPGQWYQLAVATTLEGLRVRVDGEERLFLPRRAPRQGKVGLYVEGDPVTFDDVTVYGSTLKTHVLAENAQESIKQGFLRDPGMNSWTSDVNEWRYGPAGMSIHTYEYYGDHWMMLKLRPGNGAGKLILALNSDGADAQSGCRAVIETDGNQAHPYYTLYRDGQKLAQCSGPDLNAGEEYLFRLSHTGTQLLLECDGEMILTAKDPRPVSGHYPGYLAGAAYCSVHDICVLGKNYLDYTFANAPVDWVGSGSWAPTVRWACSPQWSFLGGWSRGDAVLWHKQRFSGDQLLQAFVAPKMEYPRAREAYDLRYRDFGVTICGDGHNPRSGYAAIYGAADQQGNENQRTVLLRNGVEVASARVPAQTFLGGAHHEWFALNLRKQGNRIEFNVGGSRVLSYTDPAPLTGGVPAIWTSDNGMMVARARLIFANPAQPRDDARVLLNEPWYPEWADVHHPLTLDFSDSWSTSGMPVHLTSITRAPAGDTSPIHVRGLQVTFTPQRRGDFWYQIYAGDGKDHSADFNLALPAFDPALKRDDSHALLLYRFTEGGGSVVRDLSTADPPLDLGIPRGANVQWLPGCGLTLHGATIIRSNAPARKLMALAARKACTIEAWVSADTVCPSDRSGCLLSWETAAEQQNFSVLHQFYSGSTYLTALIIAPHMTSLSNFSAPQPLRLNGFLTGLRHIVITWDGQMTTAYSNGVRLGPLVQAMDDKLGSLTPVTGPQALPWHPESWDNRAHLLLGALSDGHRYFMGTYYLLAIHDICMSEAQIQRHYQAGPNG